MADDTPLISVILPSYNHARFVERSIRSVWAQTYPNVELVVIDDASSDGTRELVAALVAHASRPTRFVPKERNRGVSHSLNVGLGIARGEWIAVVSSDDYYEPQKLDVQLRELVKTAGRSELIHSDGYAVSVDGVVSGRVYEKSPYPPLRGRVFDDMLYGRARLIATSMMFSARLASMVSGFDETMVAEDFDFKLKCARHTEFTFVDMPLVNVRTSPSSLGRQPWRWSGDIIRSIEKHMDLPGYDWERILAEKRLAALPGYFEHAALGQVVGAVRAAVRPSIQAGLVGNLVLQVARSSARALGYRAKKRVTSWRASWDRSRAPRPGA